TASVETPFLITAVLVNLFHHCAHCQHEWLLYWPVLPSMFPAYLVSVVFHPSALLRNLSVAQFHFFGGVFTACFIVAVFLLARGRTYWWLHLAGAFVISSGLAAMAFIIIAA
ncbi:MAG: hypothetical protein ACXWDN_13100, partial [Limisphaerales bacterium]